jgi:hypothetical protein
MGGGWSAGFLAYYEAVARSTMARPPTKDSYVALVRWNIPTTRVIVDECTRAEIPGVFDDGRVRTYVGTPGDERFLELLKMSEALERCANESLMRVSEALYCGAKFDREEAEDGLREATEYLAAVHSLNFDFLRAPAERSIDPESFMRVTRQFAVHWRSGAADIPTSGAQDPEFLARDLRLGIDVPDYARHIKRIYPGLLASEADWLTRLGRLDETLTDGVLDRCHLSAEVAHGLSGVVLSEMTREEPLLGALYSLLRENARISSVHLALAKKFLFKPFRKHVDGGGRDAELVSHRAGTSGMSESLLERLNDARQRHPLAAMRSHEDDVGLPNRTPRHVRVEIEGRQSNPESLSFAGR